MTATWPCRLKHIDLAFPLHQALARHQSLGFTAICIPLSSFPTQPSLLGTWPPMIKREGGNFMFLKYRSIPIIYIYTYTLAHTTYTQQTSTYSSAIQTSLLVASLFQIAKSYTMNYIYLGISYAIWLVMVFYILLNWSKYCRGISLSISR